MRIDVALELSALIVAIFNLILEVDHILLDVVDDHDGLVSLSKFGLMLLEVEQQLINVVVGSLEALSRCGSIHSEKVLK